MKMNKFLSYMAVAGAMLLLSVSGAVAQRGVTAPDHQLGFGVYAGGDINGGATFSYAFSASVQLGVDLGYIGRSASGRTTSFYQSGIYGRFLLEAPINPFFQAGLRINGTSSSDTGSTVSTSSSRNEIYLGFGLAYYATANIGLYTMVELLDIRLDPSETIYGIHTGRAGAEWWFNR